MKDRIKQIRVHFGLFQAQLAQRINRTPGLISLVETGKCALSPETVKDICAVLPISEEWLLTGHGEMTSAAPVDKGSVKERIKQVRKDKGLTQEEFASSLGCSTLQISFLETERTNYSDKIVSKITSVFGVSREWLLTGVGEMYSPPEELDEELITWLKEHPEVIRELKERSGRR